RQAQAPRSAFIVVLSLVMVRGSFFVLRDVLQRSEYAGFDQGNLIRNQGGGGVHSADSSLDVVQAADRCAEQPPGLFLIHGTSSVFGGRPCGHGYAEAYATIIAYGTPTSGYWRKSALVATTACSLSQVSGKQTRAVSGASSRQM